jgi:hypothetical protein
MPEVTATKSRLDSRVARAGGRSDDRARHANSPIEAVRTWQEREPQTWAMVCDWLAAQGKRVVQV